MLSHAKDSLALAVSNLDSAKVTVKDLSSFVVAATAVKTKHENYLNYLTKIKEAESRLDSSKPTELLNFETLSTLIRDVTKSILDKKLEVQAIITKNNQIAVHNSTVEYEVQQLASFTKELAECQKILDVATVLQTRLDVLVKAMGSKGLVAYKVESMVKVFEDLINQYLHVLADGEFALGFTVEDTKLVLNMYSNSKLIDIKSLSSGEFNRVNTATLLAVRKMMTSMSKMDINLLILDEVVSVLDQEGKDTLIEVLLKEQNLNSIVVSHGYEHPLASKVTVTKEHNISRLDNE
jgi:DNA repair exonuclease SbcCD ATPase subunit